MGESRSIPHPMHLLDQFKNTASQIAAEFPDDTERKRFAEAFCSAVLLHMWQLLVLTKRPDWQPPYGGKNDFQLDKDVSRLAVETALLAANMDRLLCGYYVGNLYTALLPAALRSKWGVYYTPPALARRLISTATGCGLKWEQAKIIDPACGGAAFLAPVATEMWRQMRKQGLSEQAIVKTISSNLCGMEIDAFAAWMSQVLTEIQLMSLAVDAGYRIGSIARVGDALDVLHDELGRYDLVIGNPPYGKVKLSDPQRSRYSRSLYGHANLYGIFTDLALRITKADGIVAFVTPTSFLAGQYFKELRRIIAAEAPPVSLDFVHQRDGVFQDVLQETVLVVFKKGQRKSAPTTVSSIDAEKSNGWLHISSITKQKTADNADGPWLVPRSLEHQDIVKAARDMPHRLAHFNLSVSTGQLVWNRHKDQLRQEKAPTSVPLIWAESVMPDGTFRFKSVRLNHQPYFEPKPNQTYLLTTESCILVQRTTAKEQHRRLISAVLPNDFLAENGGAVVVENHLNIIRATKGLFSAEPLRVVNALLNSQVVDQIFRCISGSVAVSAYELNSLSLPEPKLMAELGQLLDRDRPSPQDIEEFIAHLYGLKSWQ